MNSLQSVVLTLSISYALIGALLLVVLVYARLPWSAKAVAVVVTSAFYIASFHRRARIAGLGERRPAAGHLQTAAGAHRGAAFAGRRSGIDLSVGRGARRRQSAEWRSQGLPNSLQRPARRKDRQGRRAKSPPDTRRAAAPPISATAKAA